MSYQSSQSRQFSGNNQKRPPLPPLPEVSAIKAKIHSSREMMIAFCQEFLDNGYLDGHFWRCGSPDNSPGKSFTMRLDGPHAGMGYDWATEEKFDVIDVVMMSRGLIKSEALARARLFSGTPIDELLAWVKPVPTAEEIERQAEKDRREVQAAHRTWEETIDIIGTDSETYLRKCRHIGRPLPMSLRHHKSLGYWEVDSDGKAFRIGSFPALVAMVQDANGAFVGIQRIYLSPGGMGKAPVPNPKKARGAIIGGAVRCCDDDDVREDLGISEGIENALSASELLDGLPTWAAVSAAGMAGIVLPDYITRPVFLPDNDPAQIDKKTGKIRLNRDGKPIYPGPDAAAAAVRRLRSDTCKPRITLLRGGKDANAILAAEKAKSVRS